MSLKSILMVQMSKDGGRLHSIFSHYEFQHVMQRTANVFQKEKGCETDKQNESFVRGHQRGFSCLLHIRIILFEKAESVTMLTETQQGTEENTFHLCNHLDHLDCPTPAVQQEAHREHLKPPKQRK